MLMVVAPNGYLFFFISHPSIMLRIGLWPFEGGMLLITLPLFASYIKWGFRYSVVLNEEVFSAATAAGTNRTIRYRPSRRAVWRWYWRAWRRRFWLLHVLLAALAGPALAATIFRSVSVSTVGLAFVIALPVVTLVMALVPQILFKSTERTVHVGPQGWSTEIGKVSGKRTWSEVASIEEWAGQVVITSASGNALIIPARALPDSASWRQFVQDIKQWHRQYRG